MSRSPCLSKSKPKGVRAGRGVDGRRAGDAVLPTTYVSIVFDAFSVTTSVLPFGANETCGRAGAAGAERLRRAGERRQARRA